MRSDIRKYVIVLAVFWVVCTVVSFGLTRARVARSDDRSHLQTARAFFQHIVTSQEWNSRHGGLYTTIDQDTTPNPYLPLPQRDLKTESGLELTLINPAYMTRLISEIAEQRRGFKFHMTSLKPLNPENMVDDWEKEALNSFEKGQYREVSDYVRSGGQRVYRYMAPLITQESCLECHSHQGYRQGDIRGGISVTLPVVRPPQNLLWISYLCGGILGIVIILGFGGKLVQLNQRLQRQAQIDGLTQIANRRYFDDYMQREWRRSRRSGEPLTVILCDVDYFKPYNDHYGHQQGDACLQQLARTLESGLRRGGDLVARYGGEEFVVVLPETSDAGAMTVAEGLRARVEALKLPHAASPIGGHITVSLGVSSDIGGQRSASELIEHADQALYRSKANGRNTVSLSGASGQVLRPVATPTSAGDRHPA